MTTIDKIKMEITTPNGSYLRYSIEEEDGIEIIHLEEIKSYHPGDGTMMVNELQRLGMRIELYAYPQDDTCTIEDLRAFYEKLGFDLHLTMSITLIMYGDTLAKPLKLLPKKN